MIAAAIDEGGEATHRLAIAGARILHISPEFCLSMKLAPVARHYVTADYATMDGRVRADITRLPFADGCFDAVFVCDVLEHIVDDRSALAELRRILDAAGVAVITVPQQDHLQTTFEDLSIVTDEARHAAYGQPDHVRNYGADFGARVGQAGFLVSEIDAHHFTHSMMERYGLAPPVPSPTHPGWNHRTVVFAQATKAAVTPTPAASSRRCP